MDKVYSISPEQEVEYEKTEEKTSNNSLKGFLSQLIFIEKSSGINLKSLFNQGKSYGVYHRSLN